ncbi:MAG: SGNH/GDSL hydrolase family protein [Polyangiaceae bacterium]
MKYPTRALLGPLFALCVTACSGEIGGSGTTTTATGGSATTATGGTGGSMTNTGGDTTTSGGTGGNTTTGGTGGVVETAPYYLIGRFDETNPAAPKSSWSGTTYRTRLSGGSLSIKLGGASDVYFEIEIDGASAGTFKTTGGDTSYPIAAGLPGGEHDVVIVRRNEGFFGDVTFLGFEPGAGASLVETPWPYLHRMELIGDSLTAGYGIEGDGPNCNFSGATESFYGTYGAIAGRNLKIAVHGIAYSGKGVFQNYGGDKTELMPELWHRTLTNSPGSAWDFSKFTPDAVVVNLGTNDFSATIAEADFEGAYTALLQEVRQKYPAAMIFCVTWAHWGASKEGWVVNAMAKANDPNLRHVKFAIDPADGYGCDYHTNLVTNAKFGAILTKALQDELGW